MKKLGKTSVCAAVAGVVMCGGVAVAGETYDAKGVGVGEAKSTVFPISKDHVVVLNSSEFASFTVEQSGNPFNGAKGPCFGLIEIKSGSTTGGGRCILADQAGAQILITWTAMETAADGTATGVWNFAGGTGKWKTATGGGRYSAETDTEKKTVTNSITDSFQLD